MCIGEDQQETKWSSKAGMYRIHGLVNSYLCSGQRLSLFKAFSSEGGKKRNRIHQSVAS